VWVYAVIWLLSAFRTRGVRKPTSKFVAACPCPDGLAQDGTQGNDLYYLAPGVLVVGVTSVARERERVSLFVCSFPRATPPRRKALDLPFIYARRGSRCTMGGVAIR
jgi:hypothetical protein